MPQAPPILRFFGEHRFLSNFFPAKVFVTFTHEGQRYEFQMPSVENAFQASKIHPKHFDRVNITESFRTLSAKESKEKGGYLTLREDWNQIRLQVMYRLVKQKFTLTPILGDLLVATGDADLFEGNFWKDCFWGVDLEGVGENHLGKTLMLVRSELQRGQR